MTTNKLPIEMRQLMRDLEEVAKASPCYSNVHGIIQNMNDHIAAAARTIELRDALEKAQQMGNHIVYAMQQSREQRDNDGKVRWLYMINWIASAFTKGYADFDVGNFYRLVGAKETEQKEAPPRPLPSEPFVKG